MWHSIYPLHTEPRIKAIYLILAPEDSLFDQHDWSAFTRAQPLRVGGTSRSKSIRRALEVLAPVLDPSEWLLIHDGARPCLTSRDLDLLLTQLSDDPVGGLLAVPVSDTVKASDSEGRVSHTVDRSTLWLAQTPQLFRYGPLREAYANSASEFTDEAAAIEQLGFKPRLIRGSPQNIKVTYAEDKEQADRWLSLSERPPLYR